jgi:hypothetical protein
MRARPRHAYGRHTMRPLIALTILAGLTLPAAAHAADPPKPTLFKVSAYGVQRYSSASTTNWQTDCNGQRGSASTSIVTRFKTARTTRVRLVRYGRIAALEPVTTREWQITGNVRARQSSTGEQASCAAVNPDSSIKWVSYDASPKDCISGEILSQVGDVDLENGKLIWTPAIGLLTPLTPHGEACGEFTPSTFSLYRATARVSVRRILESDGEPIVLRHRDERGSATDTSSTESSERATVYVTFTPIG